VVFVSCLALVLAGVDYNAEFRNFMIKYGKMYRDQEYQQRFQIFRGNVDKIQLLNAKYADVGTKFAINAFADLTHAEFLQQKVGNITAPAAEEVMEEDPGNAEATCPAANGGCDWRIRSPSVVTPVKDQGACGSCWSFSTTGSLEGAWALKGHTLTSLSEQNLLDCAEAQYGNAGCDGGLMTNAFKYIKNNGGVDTEASYPYTGRVSTCKYKAANRGATIAGYYNVQSYSESALTAAIGSVGPVSVAIDAGQDSFQFYSSGVYYDPFCSSTQLNHAVLAVGYGTLNGKAYYIVKNSWGVFWGDDGYILMARNANNNCGIASMACYPAV